MRKDNLKIIGLTVVDIGSWKSKKRTESFKRLSKTDF